MSLDDVTDEEEWEHPDETRRAGAPFNDSRQVGPSFIVVIRPGSLVGGAGQIR
jgi:hypothetical protein